MKRSIGNSQAVETIRCSSWDDIESALAKASKTLCSNDGDILWFRGCRDETYQLTPTLMRETAGLSPRKHDGVEQDLFFEFQALATELRHKGLTEWEHLFYARHFGLPTRVLDWTDTFGVALYFAFENIGAANPSTTPAIYILNPYSLNELTWDEHEISLPRYLGLIKGDFWDFGEMLAASGKWAWDGPVAIYPIQLNDRVRAQRGWFTIHGNDRRPLEEQYPRQILKLIIEQSCYEKVFQFLDLSGFNQFSMYPDLDHLAAWIRDKNMQWCQRHRNK